MAPQVLSHEGFDYWPYLSHPYTPFLDFQKYSFLFSFAISIFTIIITLLIILIITIFMLIALEKTTVFFPENLWNGGIWVGQIGLIIDSLVAVCNKIYTQGNCSGHYVYKGLMIKNFVYVYFSIDDFYFTRYILSFSSVVLVYLSLVLPKFDFAVAFKGIFFYYSGK